MRPAAADASGSSRSDPGESREPAPRISAAAKVGFSAAAKVGFSAAAKVGFGPACSRTRRSFAFPGVARARAVAAAGDTAACSRVATSAWA